MMPFSMTVENQSSSRNLSAELRYHEIFKAHKMSQSQLRLISLFNLSQAQCSTAGLDAITQRNVLLCLEPNNE